jgi:hypothetical protein
MCQAAEIYQAPFVSGKNSFYNDSKTSEGSVNILSLLLEHFK